MLKRKYVKLDQREHVLKRPGMYVGSLEPDEMTLWVHEGGKMKKSKIEYTSGLYKIFDEVLVNALDHVVRVKSIDARDDSKKVKEIRVNIADCGMITVYNDGDGIDIEFDTEHKMYNPELIFGNLLTSSNYDDSEEKIIGGQNGIGSKCCNIFSKSFYVETVDHRRKKIYKQTFENNMQVTSPPTIERYTKYPYTKIIFKPDYDKFKATNLTTDMKNLFIKRVHDVCALTDPGIKVFFNDEKIEVKSFEKYVDLYITESKQENPRSFDLTNGRMQVAAAFSDDGFNQVSFVNGVCTQKGGTHVEAVVNQISKKLIELVQKRKKIKLKPQHLKDHLFVFLNSTIVNPTFDSQTKDTLTTPPSKFGTKVNLDLKFIEKLYKSGIVEKAISLTTIDEDKNAKKTDGKKKNSIRVNKLDDANHAGTSKSQSCYLILTEGDSAKSMAVSGLSEVGRDKYGVFPLKGKVMNVKDMSAKRISENDEISNLKKILGLESGKVYKDTSDLRYGHIILMTDSDVDGSHIKGLIFNLFHTLWPSLLQIEGFISSIMTPIMKVTKGNKTEKFYNLTEYENWKSSVTSPGSWTMKYYKGLGTSTAKEAKEYFREMNTLQYDYEPDNTDARLELAFNKSKADDRKDWIGKYDRNAIISYDKETCNRVGYSTFIDKDLIHFSTYNLERAIPSVCDGFKKSIRKIMFCCFKRKLVNEIKVAQLSGYISEHGAYHHGEASLQDAIVGLAHDFVGSNNINLLMPNGQFGTRITSKDNASPRYIFTCLNPITKYIFRDEDLDVLNYLEEDGLSIEPEFYMPVIPMLLVNGACGIATGYSTNVPCYNPDDIIENLERMLSGEDPIHMKPWYKNHKGEISETFSKGVFNKISKNKVEITELPVQTWTQDYKSFLDDYIDKNPKILKDYESHYTEKDVRFVLIFHSAEALDSKMGFATDGTSNFEKEFKLISPRAVSTNNMHLFDRDGKIKKYSKVQDIIRDFYIARLECYELRRKHRLSALEKEVAFLDSRIKFILSVIDGDLKILDCKHDDIIKYLTENQFVKLEGKFDYLIKMPIQNLTHEKKVELLKELDKKEVEYNRYKETTSKELWRNDLDELKIELKKN
tara:strand:+ start:944 stop:4255 length:3312 start_codon:yes stop_codon:yes gene_type:complete